MELLTYDPETGEFRWRVARNRQIPNSIAGNLRRDGYRRIRIDRKTYGAHRLAWLYTHGKWPTDQIDHINMIKNDNRLCNLREATNAQNMHNTRKICTNTSGVKGVTWNKLNKKWYSQIKINRKQIHIGQFDELSDAAAAYERAAKTHFGEFARVA